MSNIFKPVARNEGDSEIYTSLFTKGMWSLGVGELITFNTSSNQSEISKEYYTLVCMSSSISSKENDMFSISYGNKKGLGSKYIQNAFNTPGQLSDTPSRAVYSQFKLLCLDGDENGFYLQNGQEIEQFYAVNINRDKFGDKLDPGNFELNVAKLNGSLFTNEEYTGSNVEMDGSEEIISLIDDSNDALDIIESTHKPSVSRNLVSGSIVNGIHNRSNPHYYGKVYPEQGIILISAEKLNQSASFNTTTGSNADAKNQNKLFIAMSGSATLGRGFIARAVEIKHQQTIFVRVNGNEMNYSNNPTFVNTNTRTGKFNRPYFDSFIYNPYTYVTTIGLYNDNRDLLAVAKLSKPLQKSFNSEISITVKLEY
jgi:hypothetical protein